MSVNHHGGNIVPEITREEHEGRINAKRVYSVNDASYAFTWTGGELTKIDKTYGTTTESKTLTWTGGELTSISAWT